MHKGGKMQIKAKPILKNKFWIIESGGERIGTLSKQEDTTKTQTDTLLPTNQDLVNNMLDAAIETVDDEKIPLFIQSGWSLSMVWFAV